MCKMVVDDIIVSGGLIVFLLFLRIPFIMDLSSVMGILEYIFVIK
jgi:hypothetical protein